MKLIRNVDIFLANIQKENENLSRKKIHETQGVRENHECHGVCLRKRNQKEVCVCSSEENNTSVHEM